MIVLWSNDNGMIMCSAHLGGAGEAELQRCPKAKTLITSLDRWSMLTTKAELSEPWSRCERCGVRAPSPAT